ncbi:MAG: cobalamin-dependent protein [Anaerolineae bacterium]|nr:cobalamin-dependent protein [Anaerolineae bacterium]MCB9104681.1 cobalamin B12-binding domain-containing protein [Anaerolineales bacterium]
MRVMLVNPRFRLPIDTRTTPHLGLAYLAAVSERRGDDVLLFDADVENESIDEAVRRLQPDIVGITANTPQVKSAWRTAKAIKSVKDIPVVLGGPHVSVLPAESAERPEVDVVVRGEGEDVWVKLCGIVENGKAGNPNFAARDLLDPAAGLLDGLLGISYYTTDQKEHHNPDHPPIADLDTLPFPAYHFFKMDRYTNLQPATDAIDGARSFSVMTSRGCPYRCTFCSQSIMPIKWRARSPESVLAEWQHLVENFDAQEIGVLDDSANIQVDRLEKIADLFIEHKVNHVPWIFVNGIRANLATKELLGKLKKAGLKRTAFGVESGDPDVLLSIDKKIDHDTIRQAFKNAKSVGLETIGFFIIGLPGETEESMEKTIQFACEVDPMIANFSMMTPYPGTKVYEIAKRQGRLLLDDWEDYVFFDGRARYELGDMTAEMIERKWKEAYRRFYLRPHRVAGTLMRKDFWINWRRTFKVAFNTLFPKKEKDELRKSVEAEAAV